LKQRGHILDLGAVPSDSTINSHDLLILKVMMSLTTEPRQW